MARSKKTVAVTKDQIDLMIRSIRGVRVLLDSERSCGHLRRLDQAAKRAGETESGAISGRFHVSAHRERERRFEVANCDRFPATSRSTVASLRVHRARRPDGCERPQQSRRSADE